MAHMEKHQQLAQLLRRLLDDTDATPATIQSAQAAWLHALLDRSAEMTDQLKRASAFDTVFGISPGRKVMEQKVADWKRSADQQIEAISGLVEERLNAHR